MGVPEGRIQVLAHGVVESVAPLLQALQSLAVLAAHALRLAGQALGLALFTFQGCAAGGEIRQQAVDLPVFTLEDPACPLQHIAWQAHARGHCGRRRGAGQTHAQAVGGREGVGIEVYAGVREARVGIRHLLEQAEVGRGDHPRARVGEGLEYRLGEGRALGGVGSRPDLV